MYGNQNQNDPKCVVCNASVTRGRVRHDDAAVCVAINQERAHPTMSPESTTRSARSQTQHTYNQARVGLPALWQTTADPRTAHIALHYTRMAMRINAYFDEKGRRGRPFEEGRKKALADLSTLVVSQTPTTCTITF